MPRWKAIEDAGWPVVWSGGERFGVRFASVEPPNAAATVIEISELTTRRRPVRSPSATPRRGDGSDPVRNLMG